MSEAKEQAKIAKNLRITRAVRKAAVEGKSYPGAKWFVWGESLYYGIVKESEPGCLCGNLFEAARRSDDDLADEDESPAVAALNRIAALLNKVSA